MPTFRDSEPVGLYALAAEGDYALTVTKFEQKISTGAKTAGDAMYIIEFAITPSGRCSDCLIDSAKTAWRIDVFLKACGVKIEKGKPFEFRMDLAKSKSVQWINPVGLRCWAHVIVEEYRRRDGGTAHSNKVGAYLLDRPKLDPVAAATFPDDDEADSRPTEDDDDVPF